jgi:hypothetical protein
LAVAYCYYEEERGRRTAGRSAADSSQYRQAAGAIEARLGGDEEARDRRRTLQRLAHDRLSEPDALQLLMARHRQMGGYLQSRAKNPAGLPRTVEVLHQHRGRVGRRVIEFWLSAMGMPPVVKMVRLAICTRSGKGRDQFGHPGRSGLIV